MPSSPPSLLERIAAIIDPAPFAEIGRGRAERYFRDGAGHFRKKEALAKAEAIVRALDEAREARRRGPIGKRSELVNRLAEELARWSAEANRARDGAQRCLKLIDDAGLEIRRKRRPPP